MGIKILYLLCIILTALISGLFYGFSCAVNPGLGRLNDTNYLSAMQSINRAILNPAFFASFLGALFILPVTSWVVYKTNGMGITFFWVLAATLTYIIGVFLVTVLGNVPLNQMLDKVDLANTGAEALNKLRTDFELPWNRLHLVRTLANLLSLVFLLLGAFWKSGFIYPEGP